MCKTVMVCASPSLSDLAGGEDGAVPRAEGKQRVGGTRPLELLVPEVPVVRIIHEDPAQRRLGPAALRKKGTQGCIIHDLDQVTR